MSQRLDHVGSYRVGRTFRTQAGASPVVIQCSPYQATHDFLRIEFNPGDKWTMECFEEIKMTLSHILHGDLNDFLSPEHLTVTNVHFTQDFQGLYPYQFQMIGKSEAIKQYKIYLEKKQIQSFYAGSKNSQYQYVIYDKTAEVEKHTGKIITQTTRFETRFRPEGGVSYQDLYSIQPFKGLSVSYYPNTIELPPDVHAGDFACILDAVQLHGLPKVLARYHGDKKRRATIKKLLLSQPVEWWNPKPENFYQPLDHLSGVLFKGI